MEILQSQGGEMGLLMFSMLLLLSLGRVTGRLDKSPMM